jgi:phenylalanyl-tRNA synthetase alpha chain
MQARYMEKNNPPFRIIVPGRCFRYEATDASHSHTFYQLEGLMVDRHINVANFKAVVEEFLKKLFHEGVEMKMVPSYYPFVEPGFDIFMKFPTGKWLEIMGAGMVHPNVFKAVGYVPGNWQGFAFGMGIDRIAMLKYKIDDIRLFYSGDLRFLNQF